MNCHTKLVSTLTLLAHIAGSFSHQSFQQWWSNASGNFAMDALQLYVKLPCVPLYCQRCLNLTILMPNMSCTFIATSQHFVCHISVNLSQQVPLQIKCNFAFYDDALLHSMSQYISAQTLGSTAHATSHVIARGESH